MVILKNLPSLYHANNTIITTVTITGHINTKVDTAASEAACHKTITNMHKAKFKPRSILVSEWNIPPPVVGMFFIIPVASNILDATGLNSSWFELKLV